MAALQARLLTALAPRVRPGGVLVYSVCTFTEEEGPRQVDRFLEAHPDFAPAVAPVELGPLDAGLGRVRTWPHRQEADAFFAARMLRRPAAP